MCKVLRLSSRFALKAGVQNAFPELDATIAREPTQPGFNLPFSWPKTHSPLPAWNNEKHHESENPFIELRALAQRFALSIAAQVRVESLAKMTQFVT